MGVIKLPIPIFLNGSVYHEVEIESLKTGVIADTREAFEKYNSYEAMKTFIAGSVEQIKNGTNIITDKSQIKSMIDYLPYTSADDLCTMIVMENEDDGVEGIYKCPRCGSETINEFNTDKNYDTRDHIKDLSVNYMEDYKENFELKLEYPIDLDIKDEDITYIEKLTMKYATLGMCIKSANMYGVKDKSKLQMAIYSEMLVKVNDFDIDNKWKNRYGSMLFRKLDYRDLKKLSIEMYRYGIQNEVKKICKECGKEYLTPINTASFFVSALQSQKI